MKRRTVVYALAAAVLVVPGASNATGTLMEVYKDASCGCCTAWADAMEKSGITVRTEDISDIDAFKDTLAIPAGLRSCHTGLIGGYYIEGHVPPDAVRRLIRERPRIAGLAVPGMPVGSVGMGDDPQASYDVLAVGKDGSAAVYQQIKPRV